jgi:hypothetical protein
LDKTEDQIFWLQGSPGIGKSAFAAKLVHQSNSRIMGFFKCDFQALKNPEESAKEVICTLAYQLATRMPDYRSKLLYGQGVNNSEIIQNKTADDLFSFLITEPLNKQGKITEGNRSAIVIDALDEAGRNDSTNPLLTLIKKHAPNLPDWLGIVITSRPEGYILQQLSDIQPQIVSGDTTQNTQDLKDYLELQLDPKIIGDERAKFISQIIAKSDGAFLYISQIIKQKYDLTKPELLPDGMNGYFMENFNRYFPDTKDYGKETEPFLELMVAAPGPLPKALGQELLGWTDREVTMQVTEPMGSLLQEKDEGLIFFHKSLADWLQDPKRSGRYQVNPGGAKKLGEFLWSNFIKLFGVAPNVTNSCMFKDYAGVEAIEWMPQLVSWIAELTPHVSQWHSSVAISRLPRWLEFHGKYPEAICMARRYLDLITAEGGDPSDLINAGHLLSDMLTIYEKDLREAEDISRVTLDRARSFFGAESQEAARLAHTIGNILRLRGNEEDALPFFREALRTRERLLGWGHGATRLSLGQLSRALADLGRYGELMALLVSALEASSHQLEENNPTIRWLKVRIGELQISDANFGKTRL